MSMVLKVNGASDNELYFFLKKCNSKTGAFEIKTFHKVQLKREPVAIYF